jgi:hypothetical protein
MLVSAISANWLYKGSFFESRYGLRIYLVVTGIVLALWMVVQVKNWIHKSQGK